MVRNKELSRKLLEKIERIPEFEAKYSITYENISINIVDMEYIEIIVDIRAVDIDEFHNNSVIETAVTIFDEENTILDVQHSAFFAPSSIGLETKRIYSSFKPKYPLEDIAKIRISPT